MSKKYKSKNILARYIKNEPQTSIPILTSTVFIGALMNKVGYFEYYNIPVSYINFNVFQFFINNTILILFTTLFLIFLFLLLYTLGTIAIGRRFWLKIDKIPSLKHTCTLFLNDIKEDYIVMGILLFEAFLVLIFIYLVEGLPGTFFGSTLVFLSLIPFFYYCIIHRYYAMALLTTSLLFLIICYLSGYINGIISIPDIACISGEKYKILDYYEDKYIVKPYNTNLSDFTVSNLNHSPINVFNESDESKVICSQYN